MRWFDSDFDYVQELIDRWNDRRKKIRTAYFIIAAILLIAGILTAVFPIRIFSVIQYLAAAAVIAIGIGHFIAFASMTYYFRDYILLLSGILNVLIGIMLFFMAGHADGTGDYFHAVLYVDLRRGGKAISRLTAQILPHPPYGQPDFQRCPQYCPPQWYSCCFHLSRRLL